MAVLARRLVDPIILSWGWRRAGIAAGAGAVSAVGLPPYGAFPVLFLTFPVLVWLIDGLTPQRGHALFSTLWRAFAVGWCFGFGYFVAGLWWIGAAFLVDAHMFAWLLPLGVAGLPALLACFTGVGVVIARLLWSATAWRVAALAAGLGLSEYARGTLFTGFPWNAFGYALTTTDVQMQAASLTTVHGLTILAVFVFAAPAAWVRTGPEDRRGWVVPALAALLLVGQVGYGAARLAQAPRDTVPGVTVRLVQPNLTQAERRNTDRHLAIFERYLRLTAEPPRGATAPTHIIWPESALPFLIDGAPGILSRIQSALRPGTTLIAGLQRPDDASMGSFNSLYVFDDNARVVDRYDKVHLVPFGEYLPFPDVLSAVGLEPLTRVLSFIAGTRRANMVAGQAPPFGPLICYEVIFPGAVVRGDTRPGWLVNVSDDSWFGPTAGPLQHMHQARVRATEEGLPLVRVTTTGVSAIVDAYGRVQFSLPMGTEDVLDAPLPMQAALTFAASWGVVTVITLLVATVFCAVFARLSARMRRPAP